MTKAIRFVSIMVLALVFPVFAGAYTVVFRDGHRVEIPDRFQVTDTALTYEVKPGILVTLELASIDIAATDVANGSPVGTLVQHKSLESDSRSQSSARRPIRRATRTLTNLDLEDTRLKRIESEVAYEIRRKELGLPSREESDKLREEESVRAKEMLAKSEGEQAEAEKYWRSRATDLRNEIYVVDSEIDYLRTQLGVTTNYYYVGSFVSVGRGVSPPFFSGGAPGPTLYNQAGSVRTQVPRQVIGTVGVSQGQTSAVVRVNSGNNIGSYWNGRGVGTCRFAPCGQSFGALYPYYYNSYDTSALYQRLNELETTRSGMGTRWQLLEDEARRAGAQPGWLRP